MERHPEEMVLGLMLLLLCYSTPVCCGMGLTMVPLDSRLVCLGQKGGKVYWASKDKAVVVVGKGADDRQMFRDCSIIIGAATAETSVLQLNFEAFHIKDCGVTLAVNQSDKSDFTSGGTVMAQIGCNHGNIKVLHSQGQHFVKISVRKESRMLQRYNFRINVTVIDKLPETGPETHVVVIVGVVVLFVVGTALWLLVKYLIHRTQRWHDHMAERNMERAIRLFNNQESPPESDYMYTALPPREVSVQQETPAAHHRNCQSVQSKNAGSSRGARHRAGDITFVHADGHIETFRMRDSPVERRSGDSEQTATTATPRSARSALSTRDRDNDSVRENSHNGEDIIGECPPSYDEALNMPTPQDTRSPLYMNLDSQTDDNNHTT